MILSLHTVGRWMPLHKTFRASMKSHRETASRRGSAGEPHRYGNVDFQRPPGPLGKQKQHVYVILWETRNGIRSRDDGGSV